MKKKLIECEQIKECINVDVVYIVMIGDVLDACFYDCEDALNYYRDQIESYRDDYGFDEEQLSEIRLLKATDLL